MRTHIEMIDRQFGRLTVISAAGRDRNGFRWFARCTCGTFRDYRGSALRRGDVQSCGCLFVERARAGLFKHGYARTRECHPLYWAWTGMIQRCENPKHQGFKHYGGRGIAVCARWRSSFLHFFADMGPRPSPRHSLDRINNDGNYEPGNCRWATKSEQRRNQRSPARAA